MAQNGGDEWNASFYDIDSRTFHQFSRGKEKRLVLIRLLLQVWFGRRKRLCSCCDDLKLFRYKRFQFQADNGNYYSSLFLKMSFLDSAASSPSTGSKNSFQKGVVWNEPVSECRCDFWTMALIRKPNDCLKVSLSKTSFTKGCLGLGGDRMNDLRVLSFILATPLVTNRTCLKLE